MLEHEQQLEKYFEEHAVDGALPDAEMVKLLTGTADEAAGETGDTMDGDAPTPAEAVEAKPEAETPQAQEQQPVIMAKDGRNTIPYSELADAREAAQNERSQREALQRELEALKAKYEGDAAQGDEETTEAAENGEDGEADDPLAQLREDWPEVAEALDKVLGRQQRQITDLNGAMAPIRQSEAERVLAAHYSTILNAHPDADEIMESEAFAKWREAQPSFVREVQEAVLQQGTAEQVVELFGSFKAATGWSNDAAAGDTAAQARREAARQAKQAGHATPKSLSDIPGGAAVQTDATETFLQMSDTARMDKIMGMSPEQIENMLRRAT